MFLIHLKPSIGHRCIKDYVQTLQHGIVDILKYGLSHSFSPHLYATFTVVIFWTCLCTQFTPTVCDTLYLETEGKWSTQNSVKWNSPVAILFFMIQIPCKINDSYLLQFSICLPPPQSGVHYIYLCILGTYYSILFFLTFYFERILDLQMSCKNRDR